MSVYPDPVPPPPGYVSEDPAYPPRAPRPGPPGTVTQVPPSYAGPPPGNPPGNPPGHPRGPPPSYSHVQRYPGQPQYGGGPYGGYMAQSQVGVTVIAQDDGWGRPARPPKPANYLGLSIFVLLCCNLLFGIVAVILSALSDNDYTDGDQEGATCKGKAALVINIVGIVISCIGGASIFIILFFWVGTFYG